MWFRIDLEKVPDKYNIQHCKDFNFISMIDLYHRSYQKELLDADDISFAAIEQTLKELDIINSWLGGHATTLQGVKRFITDRTPLIICEIGCGGGDNLFALYQYCQKKNIPAQFTGIDMNPECIVYAQQQYPQSSFQWICSDYALVNLSPQKPDIIFSSLFCHHFTDEELIQMLQWQQRNSRLGFFINDLHRHWLAYYLIRGLTRFFSKSYVVKNDAALSVARSFRKKEWISLFEKSGIALSYISWRWAFRWLIIGKK